MSHDIRVIPARQFLRADVRGRLDLAASKQILERLSAACTAHPGLDLLVDVRDTGERLLSSEDLLELVQKLRGLGLGVFNRVAILRRPPEAFDRARFFETLASERGFQFAAFEDFEAAFHWLFAAPPLALPAP